MAENNDEILQKLDESIDSLSQIYQRKQVEDESLEWQQVDNNADDSFNELREALKPLLPSLVVSECMQYSINQPRYEFVEKIIDVITYVTKIFNGEVINCTFDDDIKDIHNTLGEITVELSFCTFNKYDTSFVSQTFLAILPIILDNMLEISITATSDEKFRVYFAFPDVYKEEGIELSNKDKQILNQAIENGEITPLNEEDEGD